ncbi:hypothetical protein H7F15_10375 [Pontibacter sp. Tf4]|uniref:hypothetical protein n=1 Tax=Pontibacter sp. Tf4 TaxID=2761620 RepID=UPI0016232B8D|nr:hypothetical protein [Pontibacter sp. Tf4]MBB6611441.1 hypothetical protein [Pontibacter sp. Tf4]
MEIAQVTRGPEQTTIAQPALFYRITALWALCEAFLGGVLHALHLPGTGLFVGGASVVCISLLYYYGPSRAAILKATILVILVKGMLSPHTPPGAYLAVLIQGALGYLFFRSRAHYKISCVVLGVITQLQSALQRLVVMLVLFGADLYQVAHGFVNYILKKAGMPEGEYVLYVVLVYIGAHALMGVFVGWLAGRLPGILTKRQLYFRQQLANAEVNTISIVDNQLPARRKRKPLVSGVLLAIAGLLAGALYLNITPDQQVLAIVVRALLIYIVWTQLVMPLLGKFLQQWTSRKRSVLAEEITQLLSVLPFVKQQVRLAWAALPEKPLYRKLLLFLPLCLAAVMQQPD